MHFCAVPLSACSKFKHAFGGPYFLCFHLPPLFAISSSLYLFLIPPFTSFHFLIPSSFYRLTRAPDVYVARVHLALQHRICGIVSGPRIYARTQTHSHARVRVGSVCLATRCVCVQAVFLLAERWYALLTYQERKKNIHLISLALHVDAPVTSSLQTVCVSGFYYIEATKCPHKGSKT